MSLRSGILLVSLFAGGPALAEPLPTSGETIAETHAYLIESLPAVEALEAALASGKRDGYVGLISDDFHVVERADYEKPLKIEALIAYLKGSKPTKRLNSNGASIGVIHLCKGYEFREVLYNVREGRVSRIVIGQIPDLTIKREN